MVVSLPSAEPHPARTIIGLVGELDALVSAAEDLLTRRAWAALEKSLADQRRITHAISNAMRLSAGERPERFDLELRARLRAIAARRSEQLRRLCAYRDSIGARLEVMTRAKAMRRAVRSPELYRPTLIDSTR
jgi:hypothetical protein